MNCIYPVCLNNTKDIEQTCPRDSLGRQPSPRENRDIRSVFLPALICGAGSVYMHCSRVIVHVPTAKTCSASLPGWSLEIWRCSHLVVIRLPVSATLNAFLMLSVISSCHIPPSKPDQKQKTFKRASTIYQISVRLWNTSSATSKPQFLS